MQVQIAEEQSKGIRVFRLLRRVWPMDAQNIALFRSYRTAEQSIAHARELPKELATTRDDIHAFGARQKSPDYTTLRSIVRAQNRKRVCERAAKQRFNGGTVEFVETGAGSLIQHAPSLALRPLAPAMRRGRATECRSNPADERPHRRFRKP